MGNFRRANTGGRRNENPLTEEQKRQVINYAVSLGMPENKVRFIEHGLTGYGAAFDVMKVGTDVAPLNERVRDPNSNISLKGTIAHEIVGHREASLKNLTQKEDLLEEVQASIRAARFAPDLSLVERLDLVRDAVSRLRNGERLLREEKHKLHINER